ncbi:cob(I)yrinic acid a,c-diamide adenosyltransferase [Candidatus Peregrinibacteria bacterium]|nr:cob(I)yrinic acid a,c-diamide adenosyltransferase [Candidatus Peregrinibacteria bacterium]
MKITTKTGDRGQTSLFGGRRVGKDHKFVELVGELDELQSFVGWCRCAVEQESKNLLDRIQDDLYRMMSIVGFEMKCPKNIEPLGENDVKFLEKAGEKYGASVEDLRKFIRPGTIEMAARLHIARTVCRRVERRFVAGNIGSADAASDTSITAKIFIKYLNRLSDLLFVLACACEDKSWRDPETSSG